MAARRWLVVLAVLSLIVPAQQLGAPVAAAQGGCTFTLGFKALRDQIPNVVGNCLENERFNPANGNAEQPTTGGLLVWRKADNWTAFTNGHTTWINGPYGLQSRLNTQIFTWEAAGPAAAPAAPPPVAPSDGYTHPKIDPPADDNSFWCLQTNPSCGRDPWWIEWNDVQQDFPVQYSFVGPGLVTEHRFVEAIWMLWQWPDGKFLLREAANHGVRIIAVPFQVAALASYRPADQTIRVNIRFAETSTWMVADILAHELKHAADHRSGARQGRTYADCIAREQVAYDVEARYLRWVATRFGGLPSQQMVASRRSNDDYQLFLNLQHIASSPNVNATALEDYRRACAA